MFFPPPSKNLLKLIRSLQQKKYRKEYGMFVAEGEKAVLELINSTLEAQSVLMTEEFWQLHRHELAQKDYFFMTDVHTLEATGTLHSNTMALATAKIPASTLPAADVKELIVMLDGINDPGNLGTIVRTADWFGIRHIVCSPDTVDFYNPKCIAAAKGSFCRLAPVYAESTEWLKEQKAAGKIIYGATMEGIPVRETVPQSPAVLVLGSEASGMKPETELLLSQKISIPGAPGAESLNVGIAAGILMYEFARK